MKIREMVEAIGAVLKHGSGDFEFRGISTDSRTIKPAEVFFALKGPNFNGHTFVRDVLEKGAAGVVVELVPGLKPDKSYNVMIVRDTLRALGHFASYIRKLYAETPLIAVSGSAGKTTTKEMIASILQASRPILKTQGNLNNLVGLPLTLVNLNRTHKAAVVELGISESWEMERLVNICKPDIAVITNIGRGHLETLGTIEGVARAKSALFEYVREKGVKVVNLDDPWAVKLATLGETGDKRFGNAVTYSLTENADVRVLEAKGDAEGVSVVFDVRGTSVQVRLNSPALCNVPNAAAAIAAALPLGATLTEVSEGLGSFTTLRGRMEVLKVDGRTLLNDTYNSNPEAVTAALMTLKNAGGRKVAILGDMLELGTASAQAHREVGGVAASLGIDIIAAIGTYSKEFVNGAVAAGFPADRAHAFRDKAEALVALKGLLKDGDTILVKGSRATTLEEVVDKIKGLLGANV